VPTAHEDALLADELGEDELEATMKRPAIRPPSVQHQPTAASREAIHAPSNRSVSERAKASKTADASPTYRERLLKGYQHQLVGDYDEAMQEYRSIIRNAPELLNDVVSNVRALLKLAPKYAAGYRALGDAYMRQGEYLQAMEVYNKALTLAKRAKV
jgi:tetratricopeptide (TPR) repeat protein